MRFLPLLALTLAIALGLGGWTADWAIRRAADNGSIVVGPWTANPLAGSVDADPYAKALLARTGNLTLGLGEGIAFHAVRDSSGSTLARDCVYQLKGQTPAARVWTLAAYDAEGQLIDPGGGRPSWLVSSSLMRNEDNSVEVTVGDGAMSGNWLALAGEGRFVLVLTLYDTPASSSTGMGRLTLPDLVRGECRDG
ncbi:DUF1214 domain-containing protein [Consotaella aegiceratis]|uniref:DUF1214 domain-containing protein n=1 Tax=Consotaella aegiceratis TaxID=3097961 RepID=UPI002F3EC30A